MFEHGHKLEAEYRHLVTAVVSAGANVAHVCAQVKAAVEAEHRKSQWVPVGTGHQGTLKFVYQFDQTSTAN